MKQLLTISALLLMLLLQYSRQAAYLQCKLANYVTTVHCDCEQLLDNDDDHNESSTLPVNKIQAPDELFFACGIDMQKDHCYQLIQKPTAFIPQFYSHLFSKELIRPPKT